MNEENNIESFTIVHPETFEVRPLFWFALRSGNVQNYFSSTVTKRYQTNHIEGDIVKGFPINVWSYRENPNKSIKEQILFIR